jgi:hypothetical protein
VSSFLDRRCPTYSAPFESFAGAQTSTADIVDACKTGDK